MFPSQCFSFPGRFIVTFQFSLYWKVSAGFHWYFREFDHVVQMIRFRAEKWIFTASSVGSLDKKWAILLIYSVFSKPARQTTDCDIDRTLSLRYFLPLPFESAGVLVLFGRMRTQFKSFLSSQHLFPPHKSLTLWHFWQSLIIGSRCKHFTDNTLETIEMSNCYS